MDNKTHTRIEALTGLRIVAAAAIILHHLQGILWIPAGVFHPFALASGVSFFFCLSGFILHYNYRERIQNIPYTEFLWVRFFRLWPAHIAALILALALLPPAWNQLERLTALNTVQLILLLQAWTPSATVFFAVNGPAWSISVELFFYAMFPLLSVGIVKWPLRTILAVAGSVLAYLCIAQYALFDSSIRGNAFGLAGVYPIARTLEFLSGIALCEVVFRRPKESTLSRTAWTAIEIATLLALISWNALLGPIARAFGAEFGSVFQSWFAVVYCFPVFCVVIAVMSYQRGWISMSLGSRPMIWLGNISFAVYLVHQPLIFFFRRGQFDLPIPLQAFLYMAAVIGISAAMYHCIEKPGIYWSRRAIGYARLRPNPPIEKASQ